MTSSMEQLVTAVQELSLARDMKTVMEIVRKTARRLTGADGASFVLRDNEFCFYADEDAVGPLWKGQRFPIKACISGFAMLNKTQVVIEDIYKDERIPIDAYSPTFVKSLAMVPIRTISPIGAIGNYWSTNHRATEEEVHLLQSLADITAVTIENVKVYEELEQRVKERTEELEEANNELKTFSYTVSHDLQAPLRAINGYLHIFMDDYADKMDEAGKNMAKRIMSNSKKMGHLVEDLLEFSRMGRGELFKSTVDMKAMVHDICATAKQEAPTRHLLFDVSNLPKAEADRGLIRQVWVNLISNAVKYTGREEVGRIQVGFEEGEGETIYFVKDNGTGFNMKYYDKLFGVFQRLHGNEFEGSGIGLATVKKIMTKHKGHIWAEGTQGVGARFSFSLPK